MKNLFTRIVTMLTLAVACLPVLAQSQSKPMIKVNIPFEFNIGKKTFPAGEYTLLQPMRHFIVLRDANGSSVAQLFTQGTGFEKGSPQTKLRFYNRDGQYILHEVWEERETSGELLPDGATKLTIALQQTKSTDNSASGGRR